MEQKPALGYIYFVGPEHGNGPVKIGWARDPHFRLQRLQTGHPEELTIWAKVWGTMDEEKQLHNMFHASRLRERGEWFSLTDELCLMLEAVNPEVRYDDLPDGVRSESVVDAFLERFDWLLARLEDKDPIEEEDMRLARTATRHLD